MSVYRVYTISKTTEILCLYTCEKCGEKILSKVQLKGKASYNDRNAGIRPSKIKANMASRQNDADRISSEWLRGMIWSLQTNPSAETFSNAEIRCKCPKCGKKPFWTMSISEALRKASESITGLVIIFLIFWASEHKKMDLPVILPSVLLVVLPWTAYVISRIICKKKLEKYGAPLFAQSIEELREIKSHYDMYKDFSI